MRRARPSHILLVSARALAIYPAPANVIGRAIKMNHLSRWAQILRNITKALNSAGRICDARVTTYCLSLLTSALNFCSKFKDHRNF